MSLFSKIPGSPSVPAPAVSQASSANPSNTLPDLTEEDVKKALPATMRSVVTQGLVDTLNNITKDPIVAQTIRDGFIGYSGILKEGRFKTEDYLHAVAYASYKLMGDSNQDAYAKTFPQRYANLVAAGRSSKDIAAYVSAYHKGKLVNLILEQTMVPTWVLNQDLYQKALNVQADLMVNANSELVRTQAANSILTQLKKPEVVKGQLDLNINESTGMREMKDLLSQLAQGQQRAIAAGEMRTIDVAATPLIKREEAIDV